MTTLVPAPGRIIEYEIPQYYFISPPPLVHRAGSALRVFGQTHRSDLNGRFVVCLKRDGLRTLVMTSNGDCLSVADAQLERVELKVGESVVLVGLDNAAAVHNGKVATVSAMAENGLVDVDLVDGTNGKLTVGESNVVLMGANEHGVGGSVTGGMNVSAPLLNNSSSALIAKKRRLLSNLVSSSIGDARPLIGASALISGAPVQGPSSRMMAIDASVAMHTSQPILRRCGTLRKLVHGFPGFAPLVVCVIAKLHLDPSHPARVIDPSDVEETLKIASVLTDGKLDGVPRKDMRDLVSSGAVQLDAVLRIADRYCGANHLIFAIDTNFAGIRDSIQNMVAQITAGGVVVMNKPAVAVAATDAIAPQQPPAILPFNMELAQLIQNRYGGGATKKDPKEENVRDEPMQTDE